MVLVQGLYKSSAPSLNDGDIVNFLTDNQGRILVNASGITLEGSVTAGTEYTNNEAAATPSGVLSLGYDGTNLRAILTDADGRIQTSSNTDGLALESGGNLAAIATDAAAIETLVTQLSNTVSGAELQVDIVSAPTLTVSSAARTLGTFQDRSGDTGATPNQWVQVAAANANRTKAWIHLPKAASNMIEIAFGESGSEVAIYTVEPGGAWNIEESLIACESERISVRSAGTSVAFMAHERVRA